MGGPNGPIDYYVIAGPTVRDVVRRYIALTGKAPMPPKWALGYQQSRYSYSRARRFVRLPRPCRKDKIPTDVIWLDIDYQDRNRPFTVNKTAFPDLKGLVGELGAQGIKLVAITDLHVADAPNRAMRLMTPAARAATFVHNPDGSTFAGGLAWPIGLSRFHRDRNARPGGDDFREFVDDGIAGIWNDMNEPAVFENRRTMPLDIVHRIDSDDFAPRNATHAEIHNVYGMENTRATYRGAEGASARASGRS